MTLSKIISDLFTFSFTTNTFADKKHENVVKSIFLSNGLTQIVKGDANFSTLTNRKNNLTVVEELKNTFLFIDQPFGSQQSPDFIICVDGFILWIECKSGKKIVWNTGYPKTDILVVFSSKKTDRTILFFGQFSEIIENNPDFEFEYEEMCKELKEIAKEKFNNKFKSDMFNLYFRRMLNDSTKYEVKRDDFFERTKKLLAI